MACVTLGSALLMSVILISFVYPTITVKNHRPTIIQLPPINDSCVGCVKENSSAISANSKHSAPDTKYFNR